MNIQVGNVCHIALYQAMLEACGSADQLLASGPYCPVWSLASLRREGSEGDSRSRCAHGPGQIVPVTDNLRKIWEASIEDVQEGSRIGPFVSEEDISQCLECDDWTPIPRGLKWFRRTKSEAAIALQYGEAPAPVHGLECRRTPETEADQAGRRAGWLGAR